MKIYRNFDNPMVMQEKINMREQKTKMTCCGTSMEDGKQQKVAARVICEE